MANSFQEGRSKPPVDHTQRHEKSRTKSAAYCSLKRSEVNHYRMGNCDIPVSFSH